MRWTNRYLASISWVILSLIGVVGAQQDLWARSFPGHRVIGNLYAVGTYDLTVFLITSQEEHLLINTGLEDSPT